MFQIIIASFLAVAVMAAVLPFRIAIRMKKLWRLAFLRFPITFAACLRAILSRLLPFGILLLKILPPDTLLFGASLNQDANWFPVSNFPKAGSGQDDICGNLGTQTIVLSGIIWVEP